MSHKHHRPTSLLTLAASLTLAATTLTPAVARATTCPEYSYALENVDITIEPETACLDVTVEGKLEGCEKPIVRLENGCAGDVTFKDPNRARCGEAGADHTECTSVAPQQAAFLWMDEAELTSKADTHKTFVYLVEVDGADVEITVELDVENGSAQNDVDGGGSGCSVTPPGGGAPLAPFALGAIGALALAGALRRRPSSHRA